jgi:conjugative coupling factor TraD (SXT/TOL subfamily)
VYVGLDALTDPEVATAVGNACFADLVSVAGLLYKHGAEQGLPGERYRMSRINLHCDEFNELMGDEFVPLVNKGGGAGIQVTAYTQTLSDIEARVGNRARAAQVHGNFNTLIMLRVKEYQTAELLTRQLPKVDVHQLVQVSGVSDVSSPQGGSGFTSRNEDRITTASVPMIEPADVMALPRGHAFVLMEGGQLWKVRIPLSAPDTDPDMPGTVRELTEHMARDYRTGDQWWVSAADGHDECKARSPERGVGGSGAGRSASDERD